MPQPPSEWSGGDDTPPAAPWSSARQGIGIVVWSSFLAASVATLLCFAFVDPATVPIVHEAPGTSNRMTGYAIGFFLFWLAAAIGSLLTLYLVRTARDGHSPPR